MRHHARRPEQQIHRAVVQHLRQRGVPGLVFTHPANGGYRKPIEAAIFKSLGERAGASDLLLWHAGKFFALELKTPGGRVTEAQRDFLADMENAGVSPALLRGSTLRRLEMWGLLRGRALGPVGDTDQHSFQFASGSQAPLADT